MNEFNRLEQSLNRKPAKTMKQVAKSTENLAKAAKFKAKPEKPKEDSRHESPFKNNYFQRKNSSP